MCASYGPRDTATFKPHATFVSRNLARPNWWVCRSQHKPSNAQCGLAPQNGRKLSIPELHRRALFGVIAVTIVDACDVLLLRVIQDPTDHKPRHAATRHQTRRGASEVLTADVRPIARFSVGFRLSDDVRPSALRETP